MRFAVVAVGRTDAGQCCCRAERGRAPACRSDAAGDKQAKQGQQAAVQRQSERAAAAQKAAQESGIDPKTRRQYEYATRKFAAWLEVHRKLVSCDQSVSLATAADARDTYEGALVSVRHQLEVRSPQAPSTASHGLR